MWKKVSERLQNYPARLKVARTIVELGLSVTEDGKISCGPVEMSESKLARAIGVDRRVIKETVKLILSDLELKPIFIRLKPAGPFLADVAKYLGYGVIEIYADPSKVGILAKAAELIANEGISIRQAVADDPDLCPEPKLTIVTERQVSGNALQAMLKINGVHKISAY